MTVSTSGGVVTGVTTTALKDHETLTMTLTVPEGYFRGNFGDSALPVVMTVLAAILAVLALLYWWRLLKNKTLRVTARSLPPDGVNPGDIPFLPFTEALPEGKIECDLDHSVVPNELRIHGTDTVIATFEKDGFTTEFQLDSKLLSYKYKYTKL